MLACVSFPAWVGWLAVALCVAGVGSLFGPLIVHFGKSPMATFFARLWASLLLWGSAMLLIAGAREMTLPIIGFAAVQALTLWPRKRAPTPEPVSF